jgi:hypothetical protein
MNDGMSLPWWASIAPTDLSVWPGVCQTSSRC